MGRTAQEWHGIEGSAALRTERLRAHPAVARAESLAPGEMRRVEFAGDLLGAARVRGRFTSLPLEAFDAAGGLLSAEEQGAWFQLLRLSWGEGRNFCRAPKRELMRRLGATDERRLNRILDGLVKKGLLRLLHRDNHGTLFRVFLPREARGEALGDDVLLGRAANDAPAPSQSPSGRTQSNWRPTQSHPTGPSPASSAGGASRPGSRVIPHPADAEGRMAAALVEARGDSGADALAAARDEVKDLLADGATPRQIEAAIRAVARRRGRAHEEAS